MHAPPDDADAPSGLTTAESTMTDDSITDSTTAGSTMRDSSITGSTITGSTTAESTITRNRTLTGPNPFREPEQEPPRGGRHAAVLHPGWHRFVRFISKPVFVFIAVGIIAAVPRFYHLTQPHGRVFDEIYYTKDGCLYAGFTAKQCGLATSSEQSWVHPPFGKWMIAAGIRLFGNNQFGWRVSAAFIGTLVCVLIAMLAWVLWRSALWAFVAGLLAATESLLVVQSRTALLDIFQAFWIVAAFLFLALDKAWIERRTPVVVSEPWPYGPSPPAARFESGNRSMQSNGSASPWLSGPIPTTGFSSPAEPAAPAATPHRARPRVPSPFWRPWRVAAGFAFGFAIAVKWSALAAILGAMLLTILWERTRRLRAGFEGPFWSVVGGMALWLVRFVAAVVLGGSIAKGSYVVAAVAAVILAGAYAYLIRRSERFRFQPWIGAVWAGGIALLRVGSDGGSTILALVGVVAQVVAFVLVERDHVLSSRPPAGEPRTSRLGNPFLRAVMQETFPVIVCLFVLPLVVYVFTYSGRFVQAGYPPYKFVPGLSWSWMWTHPTRLFDETYQMEKFHHGLLAQQYDSATKKYTPAHPYQSRPWSWIGLGRPVAYFYKASHPGTPQERRREVLGIGNPAIFWLQFIAIPWLAVMWRRRRDWRAGLILLAILFQYGFWFLPDVSLQKVQFFFYATPIAPFFVLAFTYLVRDLSKMRLQGSTSRPFLPVAIGLVVISVGLFILFFAVLSGEPLTIAQWHARIWFGGWI